jgi:serine/threonine-protein kinase
VLVQGTEYLFAALLFPEWTHRLVVVLVALGFPLALILAWAFEITPEGVRRTRPPEEAPAASGSSEAAEPSRRETRRWATALWAGGALAAAAGLALAVWGMPAIGDGAFGEADREDDAPRSIAVLPFTDLSPEGDQQFFSDGMAEELLDALSRIDGLLVKARTSSFQFRGEEIDAGTVRDSLGVDSFLEGSVSRDGDMVRIRARLVRARDGYGVWSDSYTRRLDDVFAVQEEIAREVVAALEVQLRPPEEQRLARRPTEDFEAYELYLRGRYHWNERSVPGLQRGMELFRQALELDPELALAWAGLADSYLVLKTYGVVGADEGAARAREAAERALELEELAEAHASLGAVSADYDYDFARAEEHFRRAIALEPGYVTAHYWYAQLLADLGRTEEAVRFARRARELDPLSLLASATEGRAYYLGRRFDEAIVTLEETLDRGPQLTAYLYLGLAYSRAGAHDRAIQVLREGRDRYSAVSTFTGLLGYAYARAGRPDDAREALDELQSLRVERPVAAIDLAVVHVGLGETEAALEWIERGYEERNWQVRFLGTEPAFDPLRSEARFRAVLENVGAASS